MNCEEACVVAALVASGDAAPAELCAFEVHVAGCAVCRAEAVGFEALRAQLHAMRETAVPDSAYAALRARVVSQIHLERRRRWVLAWSSLVAAAAVCGVIATFTPHRSVPIEVISPPAPPTAIATVPAQPVSQRIRRVVRRVVPLEPEAPIVVKMFTSDPDVVIYWLADAKVQSSKKEIVQ